MAKFLGILGTLSGKLSGNVFSHNRFGPYVRVKSIPVQPNTVAQLTTRGHWASAAGGWHSLTDLIKGQWASFGSSFFIGKRSGASPAYTGFNAWTALRLSALEADYWQNTYTLTSPAATITTSNFTPPGTSPPVAAMTGNIQTAAGGVLAMQLNNATLSDAGVVSVELGFDSTQGTAPVFEDLVTGEKVGFGVFITLPKYQQANFKGYKGALALAYLEPPTITTGWTSSDKVTLNTTLSAARIASFKQWVTAGDNVTLTLYVVSENGQQKAIGSVNVAIS